MSAQFSYNEWANAGVANLGEHLELFFGDEADWEQQQQEKEEEHNDDSYIKSTYTISTRKRKLLDDDDTNKKRPAIRHDPAQHYLTPNRQDDTSSDMSMINSSPSRCKQNDNALPFDDDDDSFVKSVAKPPPFGVRPADKNFGRRRTSAALAPERMEFMVRRENQVLGVWEGIVQEEPLYTVKDYKRQVLFEGRYEEAATDGRFEQVSSNLDYLAQGRWIVHWDSDQDASSRYNRIDDLQSRRFVMRHDSAGGQALPKRLSLSSKLQGSQAIVIKKFDPSKTRARDMEIQGCVRKGSRYFVGSLSLFGLEGFYSPEETLEGSDSLRQSVLSMINAGKGANSPSKRRRDPPFWTTNKDESDHVGVTLLCALSPDENPISYQVRLAVSEEDNVGIVGIDGAFRSL